MSSVKQGGFCWSGFRYSPFLQVLIKGLFISRTSYFRSFKKRWHAWVTEIYPLHRSLSCRLCRSTGPRTSAKTSFHWVIHVPLGDSCFLALGFFVPQPAFPHGCESMRFWGPEAKNWGVSTCLPGFAFLPSSALLRMREGWATLLIFSPCSVAVERNSGSCPHSAKRRHTRQHGAGIRTLLLPS